MSAMVRETPFRPGMNARATNSAGWIRLQVPFRGRCP